MDPLKRSKTATSTTPVICYTLGSPSVKGLGAHDLSNPDLSLVVIVMNICFSSCVVHVTVFMCVLKLPCVANEMEVGQVAIFSRTNCIG